MSRFVYTTDGLIYIIGGASDQEYSEVYNTLISINLGNKTQEDLPAMKTARSEFGVTLTNN